MATAGYPELLDALRALGGAVVAFSGGTDSSLLAAAAHDALGERALAVTFCSALHPAKERLVAETIARTLGLRHRLLEAKALADPEIRANSPRRCYHCKRRLFAQLLDLAKKEGLAVVIEGSNRDDLGDVRPGLQAIGELGIRSPLLELGLGKVDVRRLARERGLPNADRPSAACLASRIPYGQPLSEERLRRIESAEELLTGLGLARVRARDHGNLLRIEVDPADLPRLTEPKLRDAITTAMRTLGFVYVTLDLLGYRTGSCNEAVGRDSP
jgi:uncharacterized protein